MAWKEELEEGEAGEEDLDGDRTWGPLSWEEEVVVTMASLESLCLHACPMLKPKGQHEEVPLEGVWVLQFGNACLWASSMLEADLLGQAGSVSICRRHRERDVVEEVQGWRLGWSSE